MITGQALEEKLKPLWAEGWPDIIDVGAGWYQIVSDLVDTLNALKKPYKILQVKEKFGGLRFYIEPPEDGGIAEMMYTRIAAAEAQSSKTCAICGLPAEQRVEHGWVHIICDKCWTRTDI